MVLQFQDRLPKTVIFQHDLGIGDLIFRLPYIRAIAKQSRNGKVSLIARPTCRADDILRDEICIEEIIFYDRWRKEDRKGEHRGIKGHWRLAMKLREYRFERIVIFSDRLKYALIAIVAGIPERIGYGGFGWSWGQRFFLNRRPFIKPYRGSLNSNYQLATELAIKHGFAEAPLIPRLTLPADIARQWSEKLSDLPSRRFAFAMGASVKKKDWGWRNFASLAKLLLEEGNGVVCLGGKAEEQLLALLREKIPPELRPHLLVVSPPSVLDSAAIIYNCTGCIGNDTGMINVAAACEVPTIVLIGERPPLGHDPAIFHMTAEKVKEIRVEDIRRTVAAIPDRQLAKS